jgi:hypothetical protein
MPTRKTKMGRVGPRTRVRDHLGLWGDHRIGADCTIARSARSVEIGDGVGDRYKVEAFASLPPGAVLEDDVFVPTRASRTTGGPRRAGGGAGAGREAGGQHRDRDRP